MTINKQWYKRLSSIINSAINLHYVYICILIWYNGIRGEHMPATFRTTKLEKFVKRLESKVPVMPNEKAEVLKEVIAEIKFEFKLGESEQ